MKFRDASISFLRKAVPFAALVFVIVIGLLLLFFDAFVQAGFREATLKVPGTLTVKRFSPSLLGLRMHELRWTLQNKEPVFEAATIDLDLSWREFLSRNWYRLVREVRVDKPGLRVSVDSNGNLNLLSLLSATSETPAIDLSAIRARVHFQNGWVLYNDRRDAGFLYELTDWDGEFALTDGKNFRFLSTGHPNGNKQSDLRLTGKVALSEPQMEMEVTLHDFQLEPFTGFPGFGPGLTFVRGAVDGSVRGSGEGKNWTELIANLFLLGELRLTNGAFRAPGMPASLTELNGTARVMGSQVTTNNFLGKAADIAFSANGRAGVGKNATLDATIVTERFSVEKLRPLLEQDLPFEGEAQATVHASGDLSQMVLAGKLNGYELQAEGETVEKASADFLLSDNLVYLSNIAADTSAGKVAGEGWVFLGEENRVLFDLEGRGTRPEVVLPGIARSADFDLKLLGAIDDPVIFGSGRLLGLGDWAQGMSEATGSFVFNGQDLLLYNGRANRGSSEVGLTYGALDIEKRTFAGILQAQDFRTEDLPIDTGVDGVFSGTAMVDADLSGETPEIQAYALLNSGNFRTGELAVDQARGEFYYDGARVLIPWADSVFRGSRVALSGEYDTRNSAVSLAVESSNFDLSSFGISGERAGLAATVDGTLDGTLGVYGLADSRLGRAALSAFRRGDGTLGGVAWIDGQYEGTELTSTVVAAGTPADLEIAYSGQVQGGQVAELGPVGVYGEAHLEGTSLTVRPTLLSAQDAPSDDGHYPLTTYEGSAYEFFGPLLAGPLKKVVIEESPFPTTRSLSLAGQAELDSGRLDLRFQVRAAGLEDAPFPQQVEDLPFQLVSGYGRADGSVRGSLGSPRVVADYLFPWLLLSDRGAQRLSLGVKGRMVLGERILQIPSMLVSQRPFDSRLTVPGVKQGPGLLNLQGHLAADQSFDVRLRTQGFSPEALAFFAPDQFRPFVPSGRLATNSLHLWGTVDNPSISGRVELSRGGVLLAGTPYPIDSAFVDFTSQAGEIRLSSLGLAAPGLDLSGSLTRRANGDLSGTIAASDIELRRLHRFDPALEGLTGRADLVARVGGRFPTSPLLELGLRGEDLVWNPRALGGKDQDVAIERFVLGRFDETTGILAQGVTLAPRDRDLFLEIPADGFVFRRAPDGLTVTASGAVTVPTAGLMGREFKTFAEMADYFGSPNGPDFGRNGTPFEIALRNLTTSEASLLTGRATRGLELRTALEMSLEGQWWRDHKIAAGDKLPHYLLTFEELMVENRARGSGLQLDQPASLEYQREGLAGYLDIRDWQVGFFSSEPPPEGVPPEQVDPEDLILRQGVIDAAGRLALTQAPGVEPKSEFHLGAADIPLANLRFLLPEQLNLSGLVDSLEVSLSGVLPSPNLMVRGLAVGLDVGPLSGLRVDGLLQAFEHEGAYRVVLGEEGSEGIEFTVGTDDVDAHGLKVDGTADITWTKIGKPAPDRLSLFARNIGVSLDSPLSLTATVVDENLQALARLVPGQVRSSGTLTGSLGVTGTVRRPEFEGEALLENGRFDSQEYGTFANLQLDAKLNRITREEAQPSAVLEAASSGFLTRLAIEKLEGTLGGKPFFGGGLAEFAGIAPTFLDLFFTGEMLPVRLPRLFVGRADVDLEINGREVKQASGRPVLRPQLTGLLVFPEGDFTLPLSAASGSLPTPGQLPPADIDVGLSLGQEFFVKALNSRVRAVGDLKLVSEQGEPKLYGQVQLSRGVIRIPFYDAQFRVRQGVAIFDGPFIPRLQAVEAVADLGGYRITARANGRYPDSLNLELYSTPPLPQAELNRLAVVGGLPPSVTGASDPAAQTGSLGSLSNTGVSFLSGILTNRLTDKIGNLLFLSELSFDYIPPATYAIKVAKSLDPNDRFLLTLTRIIRDNGLNENLFGIEWRLTQNFLARVAFDQLSRIRLWIQSINAF